MMQDLLPLVGLFFAALGAATILPIQSEFALAGLIYSQHYSLVTLIIVATAGNVIGSWVNWLLGRYIAHFQDRRWFPVKPAMLRRATRWYERWGFWSLLLAWMPVIGDPLTLVAGVLRVRLVTFFVFVTIGKALRYVLFGLAL
jgi:membrane protein YqaA with SNARE-associated domain